MDVVSERLVNGRFPVEPQDIAQHRPKTWPEQISLLSQDRPQSSAAVLQRPAVQGYGEIHLSLAGLDVQMAEERRQVGVVFNVVDNEAGINGTRLAIRPADIHGVGVAS